MPRAALGTAREVYLGKSIEGVLRRREVRCTWALVRNQGVACACAWCACAIKLVHAHVHVTCCMHMCMHMLHVHVCMCMCMCMCACACACACAWCACVRMLGLAGVCAQVRELQHIFRNSFVCIRRFRASDCRLLPLVR